METSRCQGDPHLVDQLPVETLDIVVDLMELFRHDLPLGSASTPLAPFRSVRVREYLGNRTSADVFAPDTAAFAVRAIVVRSVVWAILDGHDRSLEPTQELRRTRWMLQEHGPNHRLQPYWA